MSAASPIADMPAGGFWAKPGMLPDARTQEDRDLIEVLAFQKLRDADVPSAKWWLPWRKTIC